MKSIIVGLLILSCASVVFGQSRKIKKPTDATGTSVQTKKVEEIKNTTPMLSNEEYAVFIAVLGKDKENFVVQYRTDATDYMNYSDSFIKRKMPELKDETFDDFNSKNKDFSLIERKFNTNKKYAVLTKEENDKMRGSKGLNWDAFYKKYPKSGGFYIFSRVGFSKDSEQVLLLLTFSCGSSCGEGTYYLLKKENNDWKIIKSQTTWKS